MNRFRLIFLLPALFVVSGLQAQSPKYRVVSVPVAKGNKQLKFPWTGGMNAPQFSSCELNNDGIPDLFVFDRVGNKVLTYINLGNGSDTTFQYAPQYENLFPSDLEHWALIRDYNKDGIPDIFTRAVFFDGNPYVGTRVLKGKIENGHLAFDVVRPVLYYRDGSFDVNIWTNVDDIPVFTDVNRDGDIDILTFGIFGSTVEYYENQTVEHAGDPQYHVDSLKFLLETMCWGNFSEHGLTNSIMLNISCKGTGSDLYEENGTRHSGSTIFNFDADNDHDVDLLLGDISFNNLVFVQNCGDSSYANACAWDSLFPSCNTPALMPIFPAAYGVDADNDGTEDMLVAPNARQGATDVSNVMFYKGTGNPVCVVNYQSDTFLTHHSLDFGTDSKPVLFDFNNDGLLDIVVGNYGYFRPFTTYKSAIAVYLNTGTSTNPRFELLTDDYNTFSNFAIVGMHPAFGDLDGDGKPDMLVGDLTGYLHFFKNNGSSGASFPSMTTPQYFGIDVGQYSAPFIYDVNGDNLNDLIIGRRDGRISYYWNFGTTAAPLFHADSVNNFFGNVNVTVPGFLDGYACPFVTTDSAGNKLLYSGSTQGSVFKYLINPANLRSGSFQMLDSNVVGESVGSKSVFTMADLNNDGWMEYIIGNSRGGLMFYSDSVWDISTLPIGIANQPEHNERLFIYPNPAKDFVVCRIETGSITDTKVEVVNMLGQTVELDIRFAEKEIRINTQALQRGVYFVRIKTGKHFYSGKFIVGE
ncbi:MAG: T9SS type A sorting domain-containing protein [Chitinophagales bacterium]|nr:T9SS type A sorting domain-containing protein [Chitinophagales bacterium]